MYGLYYQAHVAEKHCWYFVGVLRSFEHLVFDRTFDKQQGIFEFFLPPEQEEAFLAIMEYFKKEGIIAHLVKMEHRLMGEGETV